MYGAIKDHLKKEIEEIKEAGLFKSERIITSSQDAVIKISTGEEVINFCANNYLGLSNNLEVIQAAKDTMDTHGFGVSSVRFICGTQDIHKQLESKIAEFYQTEDTILYAAAFDANGGVFEPLLSKEDAIISDSLNHASIIDGVRLCKASRYRYDNNNMEALEAQLIEATKNEHRFKIIVTDGVFSMDGIVAKLDEICDLADKYDACQLFTTPAVGDGVVAIAGGDGILYLLEQINGSLRWQYRGEGDASGDPVIAGKSVVFAASGALTMLSLADGARLWSTQVSDEITSPALIGGMIVVGADDGTVSAYK